MPFASTAAVAPESLEVVVQWLRDLPAMGLEYQMNIHDRRPREVAIVGVDLLRGPAHQAVAHPPLSEQVSGRVARLLTHARELGVRHLLLLQDAHPERAREFVQYVPHGVAGTPEAEMAEAVAALPFQDALHVFTKPGFSPALGTDFVGWLDAHPDVRDLVVVGTGTDLGVYQTALYLRDRANVLDLPQRVIVPRDCVTTYDLSAAGAASARLLPHPADLFEAVFLYSLALNGVLVVSSLER